MRWFSRNEQACKKKGLLRTIQLQKKVSIPIKRLKRFALNKHHIIDNIFLTAFK